MKIIFQAIAETNAAAISANGINPDLVDYTGMRIINKGSTGPSIETNYNVKVLSILFMKYFYQYVNLLKLYTVQKMMYVPI